MVTRAGQLCAGGRHRLSFFLFLTGVFGGFPAALRSKEGPMFEAAG